MIQGIVLTLLPFSMSRSFLYFSLTAGLAGSLSAQVGDGADIDRSKPPAHWNIPAAPVRTPEESMRRFDLPPGFKVELVAAEPLVQDPIFISFDERGRLWVLEWPKYNEQLRGVFPGLEKLEPPKARVAVLEDRDGDGKMDQRTVFLDGIDYPRGLQIVRGGALVLKLPELVFAQDTDGDGKADRQDVLVKGLETPANPHAAQSNLLLAMDNWVYGSKFTQRMRFTDGAWRFGPSLSLRGQWGFSQDNLGRFYYSSNGDHLRGDVVPEHYYTRNPNYSAAAGVDEQFGTDQTVWPHAVTSGTNRRGQQRDEDGRLQVFTSNTSPTVYRGDQFPSEYVGNVFLGEVAGRLVRRSVLTEKDGLLTAENAYPKKEFLFSHDERFRPVFTANGPDGTLYVADMYRGIIEGHLFITSYLRNQIIDRKLQESFLGMGRIYRIVNTERPRSPAPRVNYEAPASWVALLAHPNGFWRDTAQRLLVEKGDRRVVGAIQKMALTHASEWGRLHALWTLEGLAAVTPAMVTSALADSSWQVRQAALRLSEPFLQNPVVAAKVIALTDDNRIEVRRQLLFTLGEGQGQPMENAMLAVLARDAAEPIMVEAALSGLRDRELAMTEALLKNSAWSEERKGARRLLAALGQAVVKSGRMEEIDRLLVRVAAIEPGLLWQKIALLDGMVDAKLKGLSSLPAALASLEKSDLADVKSRASALHKGWSSPLPKVEAPAATARKRAVAGFDKGAGLFAICSACHGAEGQGQPSIAPALAGSAVIAGPVEDLIRTVLFGRNQDRKNPGFPDMPPLGGLGDNDIAAVVTYVRAKWGNATSAVTGDDVKKIRDSGATANPAAKK